MDIREMVPASRVTKALGNKIKIAISLGSANPLEIWIRAVQWLERTNMRTDRLTKGWTKGLIMLF